MGEGVQTSPLTILNVHAGKDTAGQGIRAKEAFERHAPEWRYRTMNRATAFTYLQYPKATDWNDYRARVWWEQSDVIHLHNNFQTFRMIRGSARALVIHHHGTELREHVDERLTEQRRLGAIGICSTLDLHLLAPDEIEWLPAPYDLDFLAAHRRPHGRPMVRIAHAPTNRQIKSTEAFLAACERLIAEGHRVEVDLIEQTAWADCLRRKGTADIFFDQAILGYGCNSIEAWGMGLPVVCGAAPETEAEYRRRFGALPYYRTTPDTIFEALRDLVLDAALRAKYGRIGLEHARRFHDERLVVERYQRIYHRAAGAGYVPRPQPDDEEELTMSNVLRAKTTFRSGQRIVRSGEIVAANDPVVKGREALFTDPDSLVEQATAAPGEKRAVTRKK